MLRQGTRAQVMHGTALKTSGGLKKKDLKYNKQGRIVSKLLSVKAKKEKRLEKAGWTTQKGEFGAVQMRGGLKEGDEPKKKWEPINDHRREFITKIPKNIALNYLKDNEHYKEEKGIIKCNHNGIVKLYFKVMNELKIEPPLTKTKAKSRRTRELTDYLGYPPDVFIQFYSSLISPEYSELAKANSRRQKTVEERRKDVERKSFVLEVARKEKLGKEKVTRIQKQLDNMIIMYNKAIHDSQIRGISGYTKKILYILAEYLMDLNKMNSHLNLTKAQKDIIRLRTNIMTEKINKVRNKIATKPYTLNTEQWPTPGEGKKANENAKKEKAKTKKKKG